MKVFPVIFLVSLLSIASAFGQENKPQDTNQLVLENMNLKLRVMRLEYKELKVQRDKLQELIKQQVESKLKEKPEEE